MIYLFPTREIAINLFGWSIYWYGIMYVLAVVIGYLLLPHLQKYRQLKLSQDIWLVIITASFAGTLIGGRLGYVTLYEPSIFWLQPFEIFSLRQGGMSSHGGFIGVILAIILTSRFLKLEPLKIFDLIIVPVALGLTLGRIGNVINHELFMTTFSQIAAVSKNIIIALVCFTLLRSNKIRNGHVSAVFLIIYSILRFLIEFIREQQFGFLLGLSRGQLYSIPIFIVGVTLWLYVNRTNKEPHHETAN